MNVRLAFKLGHIFQVSPFECALFLEYCSPQHSVLMWRGMCDLMLTMKPSQRQDVEYKRIWYDSELQLIRVFLLIACYDSSPTVVLASPSSYIIFLRKRRLLLALQARCVNFSMPHFQRFSHFNVRPGNHSAARLNDLASAGWHCYIRVHNVDSWPTLCRAVVDASKRSEPFHPSPRNGSILTVDRLGDEAGYRVISFHSDMTILKPCRNPFS